RVRRDALPRHPDEPPDRRLRHPRGVRCARVPAPPYDGERMKGGPMATRPTARTDNAPTVEHRFFELIPPGLRIDFVGLRFKMLIASWSLFLIGLVSIYLLGGLNVGIAIVGGSLLLVLFAAATPVADMRAALSRPELRE